MKFLKKYYIYAIELILGNILFNTIYALVKTLTFHKIGATNETFINNMISRWIVDTKYSYFKIISDFLCSYINKNTQFSYLGN